MRSREILDEYLYPRLRSEEHIPYDEVIVLQEFCQLLLYPPTGEELDLFILFEISDRLLKEWEYYEDDTHLGIQLNIHVSCCYANVNRTARITTARELNTFFRDNGLAAAETVKKIIHDKERFSKIEPIGKQELMRAYKFYSACYDTFFWEPDTNVARYQALLDAIGIAEDEFYVSQMPDYPWTVHLIRCHEHMGQLTERGNRWGFTKEQCLEIAGKVKRLEQLWEETPDHESQELTEVHFRLIVVRNEYFAGLISLEEYQRALLEMYEKYQNKDYDMYSVYVNLLIPTEYIATMHSKHMSARTTGNIKRMYEQIIEYVLNSSNMDAFNFLQEYLVGFLQEFIEIPGVMTFEEMGLYCLAALHPPTYVHSLQVADITKLMTEYMLSEYPEEFVGISGCETIEQVKENADRIIDYAYHCGLCHDFGKIALIDTIFIYGRNILDKEYEIIRMHSKMGEAYLQKYASTKDYAAVAGNHHKWWNNEGGYPQNSKGMDVFSGILEVADCIDAATDSIGRSYNQGKTLSEVIEEIIQDQSGKYMPKAKELVKNPQLLEDLDYHLTDGRMNNYKKAFLLLHGLKDRLRV